MKFRAIFSFLVLGATISTIVPIPSVPVVTASNSNVLSSMTSSIYNSLFDLPAEARGRRGSTRIGGSGRSGRGSTYRGGW